MSVGSACSSAGSGVGALRSNSRLIRRRSRDMALSVADVYDLAADIGKEFEVLIDSHGPEHVTQLMQKVISSLEQLEKLATLGDAERETIENLNTTISHLELEDTKKIEERQRNSKELEQIEEHYKQETRDLLSTVKRLQDENRKLASSLAAATERDSAFSEDESYFEVEIVEKLQSVVEKQRGQIKKLEQSNIEFKSDNEELRRKNEKLISCTKDIRRKLRTTQSQLHLLVDERAELTAKVHDQQRDLHQLQRQLGKAAMECEELSQTPSLKGKVIYDENDPQRPRFSLPELRDILQERNALKARVSDLEDELIVFRPRPPGTQLTAPNATASPSRLRLAAAVSASDCDCSYHSRKGVEHDDSIECEEAQEDQEEDEDPNDLPVQGPLPQEPEDAPWKRNDSGVRRFFSFITDRVSSVSQNLVASAEQELQSPFRMRPSNALS